MRPSPNDLLTHPFVMKAIAEEVDLQGYVQEVMGRSANSLSSSGSTNNQIF